ncbi:hypothetical protein NQZ68_002478 [Dissostichus eleginoides]|nr:hypothetical protein NQZ68_002478 [Dissostichus eleginoides]
MAVKGGPLSHGQTWRKSSLLRRRKAEQAYSSQSQRGFAMFGQEAILLPRTLLEDRALSLNIGGEASDAGSVAATDGQTITGFLKQAALCRRATECCSSGAQIALKMT